MGAGRPDGAVLTDVAEDPAVVLAQARAHRFVQRGMDEATAAEVAERLGRRDADRDDRAMCIECAGLSKYGRCLPAQKGAIAGASRDLFPVQTILMRCERFDLVRP